MKGINQFLSLKFVSICYSPLFCLQRKVSKHGDWYRYLRLEQETERAHHELNLLEEEFRSVKNKAQKYYLMLKAFKNKQKIDKGVVVPRKRF